MTFKLANIDQVVGLDAVPKQAAGHSKAAVIGGILEYLNVGNSLLERVETVLWMKLG